MEDYLKRFQWADDKYPVHTPLRDMVDEIVQVRVVCACMRLPSAVGCRVRAFGVPCARAASACIVFGALPVCCVYARVLSCTNSPRQTADHRSPTESDELLEPAAAEDERVLQAHL